MIEFLKKLASRKLIVATLTALVVFLNEVLHWNISEATATQLIALALGWIGVEGAIDFKAVGKADSNGKSGL